VVSAPDCGVRGPTFESHSGRLCLLWQSLWQKIDCRTSPLANVVHGDNTYSCFLCLLCMAIWATNYDMHIKWCESFPGSLDECRLSARWPPTLRTSQLAWAVSLLPPTSAIAIVLLLSLKDDTHFTIPRKAEGQVDLGTAVEVHYPCPRLWAWVVHLYSSA